MDVYIFAFNLISEHKNILRGEREITDLDYIPVDEEIASAPTSLSSKHEEPEEIQSQLSQMQLEKQVSHTFTLIKTICNWKCLRSITKVLRQISDHKMFIN